MRLVVGFARIPDQQGSLENYITAKLAAYDSLNEKPRRLKLLAAGTKHES
jgi:hypothetical protein